MENRHSDIGIGEPRFDSKIKQGDAFHNLGPCWIWTSHTSRGY